MLQANQPGVIILLSSTGAQKANILTPLYQASKAGISTFTRCMAKLTELAGIRVVAVAPGPTMSPLMYDHPEALRFVDPEKDRLASPDEIARGMMGVCFDNKFPPGTVLEVTHPDRWREVSLLNDPGPDASAWTSRKGAAIADVIMAIEADREGGRAKL
jgi:3-hydroxybutyrate dehydrogenase